MGRENEVSIMKLTTVEGAYTYRPRLLDALAEALVEGSLLYCQPCDTGPPERRYDARKGGAPRWGELTARLRCRGLELVECAPFYFEVRTPQKTALSSARSS